MSMSMAAVDGGLHNLNTISTMRKTLPISTEVAAGLPACCRCIHADASDHLLLAWLAVAVASDHHQSATAYAAV